MRPAPLRVAAAAIAVSFALGLSACSAPAAETPVVEGLPDDSPTIDRVISAGELVVGTPDDMPGFNLLDPISGEYTGFEARLAELLSERILGETSVRHVAVTTDTREALIQNGTVDAVLSTYQITSERLEKIDFAGPDLLLGTGIVSAEALDLDEVTDLSELADLRLITTAGAAADLLTQAVPGAEIIVFDSVVSCVQALMDGRGDVFINNEATAIAVLSLVDGVKIVPNTLPLSSFGIGVSKDDPAFTHFVNAFLEEIIEDGTWAEIWEEEITPITGKPAPAAPVVGDLGLE